MTASPLITKIDELQEELLASLHEIRRHAAELTAERERLQPVAATLAGAYVSAITKGLPVAMGFLDAEGVLTYAESANLEPEHAGVAGGVGRSMFDLRGNVPQFTAALRRALTGERVRVNFENPCTPGREMEVVIEALRSADHEVSGLVAVATQASAPSAASPPVGPQPASTVLGEGTAASLVQLLASILGNAALAQIEVPEDAPLRAMIREIEDAAVRAAEVLPCVIPQDSQITGEAVAAISGLTPRQREILQLVSRGFTNAEIAAEIFISVRTVERHLANLYASLGVHARVAAVRVAIQAGLG